MGHLSPDVFIDLLDGTRAESEVAHLESCAACRAQLSDLRRAWQATTSVDAPEPSPLFWEHLSARVHDAVAAEATRPGRLSRVAWWSRAVGLLGAAAAAIAIVVALQGPRVARQTGSDDSAARGGAAVAGASQPVPDDESLRFVADLASSVDWNSASASALIAHGDADRAVAEMNSDERAELRRLLNDALGDRPDGTL